MIFNQNKKERYSIVSRLLDTRYSAKESKREISIYGYAGGNISFTALQTSDWNQYTLCKGIKMSK